MGSAKKKFYAVANGKVPGIYTRWAGSGGAQEQVMGFPNARYKGFATREAAQAYLDAGGRDDGGASPAGGKRSSKAAPAQQPPPADAVTVYSDGGALGNPGPGGYGVVVDDDGAYQELTKGFRLTTNNRMELMGAIAGIRAVAADRPVALHTDSRYVVDGITKGWARRWRANGWMRTKTDPAKNADLWKTLLELSEKRSVTFHWVRGHSGIDLNERCDRLAVSAAADHPEHVDQEYERSLR